MKLKNIGKSKYIVPAAPGPKGEKQTQGISPGKVAEIPDAHAKALLENYPDDFAVATEGLVKASAPKKSGKGTDFEE